MRVLILGDNHERCQNYEDVLKNLRVDYDLALDGDLSKYDRLIIPGGIDVDPALYNEEKDPTVDVVDRPFDDIQIKAIKYFIENKKPILGICRGMQLLNVVFGGSLIQDIKTTCVYHRLSSKEEAFHEIKNNENTFMYQLYGKSSLVNTFHHQAVKVLASDLEVVSQAEDGIIEAYRHKSLPIIAVQFHPERMALRFGDKGADGYKIFNYFINELK